MNGTYISYHAFTWAIAKRKFTKSILKANGEILQEEKLKNKYLVKVSNPSHHMNKHPKWSLSSKNFWRNGFKATDFK